MGFDLTGRTAAEHDSDVDNADVHPNLERLNQKLNAAGN